MTGYFRLPVIPTVLGFNPRLQFLHEQDALDVLEHATISDVTGTFNVAGDGIITLAQAVRRIGRPSLPLPGFAVPSFGSAIRQTRVADFSPEQVAFLTFGRGLDTTRMRYDARLRAEVHHGRRPSPTSPPRSRPGYPRPDRVRATESALVGALTQEGASGVGDAEIIPIGTRGKPGRGTGRREAVLQQPQPRRQGRPHARPCSQASPGDRERRARPTRGRPPPGSTPRREAHADAARKRGAGETAARPEHAEPPAEAGRAARPGHRSPPTTATPAPASRRSSGSPPSPPPPRSCSATTGSRGSRSSSRSCAAG